MQTQDFLCLFVSIHTVIVPYGQILDGLAPLITDSSGENLVALQTLSVYLAPTLRCHNFLWHLSSFGLIPCVDLVFWNPKNILGVGVIVFIKGQF